MKTVDSESAAAIVVARRMLIALCLMAYSVGLTAGALSLTGTIAAEATIYEDATGHNGGGYGSACVGNQSSLDSTRRAFIRYNLPAKPAGAVITRVRLELVQERVRKLGVGSPKTATLRLQRITSSWIEGAGIISAKAACGGGSNAPGVDWLSAPAIEGSLSGVEDLPTAGLQNILFDTDTGTDDDSLISDVEAWYAQPELNFGWRWSILEESTTDNARLLTPGILTLDWAGPEISLSGNDTVIISGDTTPMVGDHTDFESVDISAGQKARTFTITNQGPGDLILSGIPRVAVSGPNAAEFTITRQPDSPVPGTTSFEVTFDPVVDGLRSATLSIENNDFDVFQNPFTFSIQGTGTTPRRIGGSLDGLASGNSLVLQNNAGDNLVLNANGPFTFATELIDGSPYDVTVLSQPANPIQDCSVKNNNGIVSGADITNISVTCEINFDKIFSDGFES